MGDHSFTSLIKDSYFYGAHGILAVYDVSRDFTRHNLERWSVLSESATFEGIPKVVLGNKVDLLLRRDDASDGLDDIARKIGAGHGVLTSAKTGEGVEGAFQAMANLLVDYYKR
jgi:GTPase SAR1 family protein